MLRDWSVRRLALLWVAVVVGWVLLDRLLEFGTIEGRVIDARVSEISGYWSPSFASSVMVAAIGGGVLALLVTTTLWIRSREERVKRRMANDSADNRILIGPPRPGLKKGLFDRS